MIGKRPVVQSFLARLGVTSTSLAQRTPVRQKVVLYIRQHRIPLQDLPCLAARPI